MAKLGRLVWMVLVVHLSACQRPHALIGSAQAAGEEPAQAAAEPAAEPRWQEVEALIKDQKLQQAATKVELLLGEARLRGDQDAWAKALIQATQLKMALGAYESAVRYLKDQPWPEGLLPHVACELYYAQALVGYLDQYSWEIRQRETVATGGPLDLKLWTAEQIYGEALAAFDAVWARRDALGGEPISRLSAYIQPNTYPEGVRSTLRDAVTYMAVELLANESYWTAEQANGLYRLDFASLLAGKGSAPLRLAAAEVHPLTRAMAALSDLQAWHRQAQQPAAELETRLERVRRLQAAFPQPGRLAELVKYLADLLPDYRRQPWWSMGMAELATLQQTAGNLVAAHDVALEGASAYADAVGGQRCLSIQRTLDAPSYELTVMTSDRAQRRSFLIRHKNIKTLYFRAYAYDLVKRLESSLDYNLLPTGSDYAKLGDRRPDSEWQVDLPATPDLALHDTYVTPPFKTSGLYLIAASARPDFKDEHNRIVTASMVVSDLVLLTRQGGDALDVTVVDGANGAPVAGAAVTLYRYDYQKGHRPATTATSDATGGVTFHSQSSGYASYFLVASKGTQIVLDPQYQTMSPAAPAAKQQLSSFLYTDRGAYRPGQQLLWKVVAYHGNVNRGSFQATADTLVTVTLYDANNQSVASTKVKTNAYGSASGGFAIPAGKLLGQWSVRSSYGAGQATVRVEEYKRPTFEVAFKDAAAPMRLNRSAELTGEARYYFGLPVAAGAAHWKVTREPLYPVWWGYLFGRGAARGASGAQIIAAGTSALDGDGHFIVPFLPAAEETSGDAGKGVTYRFTLSADVTDEGGETRSASRTFRLGAFAVEAAIDLDAGFLRADQAATASIKRTSLDGVPRAGTGRFRLLALQQPPAALPPADLPLPDAAAGAPAAKPATGHPTTTPGDLLRPRWRVDYTPEAELARWADGPELARGDLTHDARGLAVAKLPPLPGGAYRLRYDTTDEFGGRFATFRDVVVASSQPTLALPALLEVEAGTVKVGGTARFLAHSGLAGQRLYFDLYQGGKLRERRILTAGVDALVAIPVTEADRGGLAATLTVVADHQLISFSRAVRVPWDDKELTVEFSSFRDLLRPGQAETWRLHVKGPKAAQATAEVLAYMYDRSLDLVGTPLNPTPLAIYPTRDQSPWLNASLGEAAGQRVSREDFAAIPPPPALSPDQIKGVPAHGIGGLGRRRLSFGGPATLSMADAVAPLSKSLKAAPRAPAEADAKDRAAAGGKDGAGKAEAPPAAAPAADQMRANFAETAFFQPHLRTDAHGDVAIEFRVPDSVTAWNVWVVALTKDLHGGVLRRDARSVKDLMVRPYLPRFLREGDRAELKVEVDNASAKELAGDVSLELFDTETGKNLTAAFGVAKAERPFRAKAGAGAGVTFALNVPRQVGTVAFKVSARASGLSDGELRSLPVLPSRMHLVQSRFVTLQGAATRSLSFPDLAEADDPSRTNEQLVIGVDGQLFYSVLKALPYLVTYPYECTEQTLNRFLATGIVSSVYDKYPEVARMARQLSTRDTRLAPWSKDDPNRRMSLEETPWLEQARGGPSGAPEGSLANVLDERIAKAQRDAALTKLTLAQTANGGFPWFAGGPPSPWMTLYLMGGFAKAAEFHVPVPKAVVTKGWAYLAEQFRSDYAERMVKDDCCWEFLTFLNYVASAYPDPSWTGDALTAAERAAILAVSFKHWREHSPYLKAYLALTLKRAGRAADAKLVWDSVMDAARTAPDQGTFWAPEDRAWLWYNDTTETQAFALRTLLELDPHNAKKDGLVLWLFLNKKLNHWKSTRATAEVIYALVHYLEAEPEPFVKETAEISAGALKKTVSFDPAHYTGRAELVVPGPDVGPATATVTVTKHSQGVMFASATWLYATDRLPAAASGDFFTVTRRYFKRTTAGKETVLQPLAEGAAVAPGDELEVQLALTTKHEAEYVHLRDPRGAGFEPVNQASRYRSELGLGYYEEVRDSGANFFLERLPVGEFTFKYRIRAAMSGTFRTPPATVQSMYAPEFAAFSAGAELRVAP